MKKTFKLGYVDYNKQGRADCLVTITVKYEDGVFSATGEIWNPRQTDCHVCGQCLDEIAELFPQHETAQRLIAIWREWHLNDLTAGSPAQEAYLKSNPVTYVYPQSHYEVACDALKAAGLQPDLNYLHNGKPYAYGTAWLRREIPADIAAEIETLLSDQKAAA